MSMTLALEDYIDITFSEHKLHAYLHFVKYDESFGCTFEQLESFVRSHEVRFGVLTKVLQEIASNPVAFKQGATMIAEGKPSVSGEDGYIRMLIKSGEQEQRPLEHEDGTVDLKQVKNLDNILKGQRIAQRIPARPGIAGIDVTGEPLKSKDGKEARFKIGKNVVVDQDGNFMYATIDGLIARTDREKINVFPVYEVNGDVDYRTGNIDFVGTIVIRGNVLTGFTVKASGDIRVYGGVEGALIEALGSVEVTGGIIAGNKGLVKAGHNVKCSFIQEANVSAFNDVLVTQSILHSHIRAGKQVACNGTKGLIVGGIIQAGERVSARTIGNTMSTATVLEVGVQPDLRNELTQLRSNLRTSIDGLEKTEKALRLLDQLASTGQLTGEKLGLRIKLNSTKKQVVQEQTEIRDRIFEIEKMLEDTTTARVDVFNVIYGGSKIVIGRNTRFVKDASKRVTFRLSEGDIVMNAYQ
ncbi:DUF342 domain-containing protein [Paenibacillus sp. 481]|uniref:DUF342 domain-containing protein n=1 Tax=Paenibacillus sp. 481 TaxID=2835869 RepID=UPI001E5BD3E6|nr:FapA family protein [Paenibacillus sp. 481]UHA73912.1 DUF342 domain-containing protein [Paenibacillus sp. 481]